MFSFSLENILCIHFFPIPVFLVAKWINYIGVSLFFYNYWLVNQEYVCPLLKNTWSNSGSAMNIPHDLHSGDRVGMNRAFWNNGRLGPRPCMKGMSAGWGPGGGPPGRVWLSGAPCIRALSLDSARLAIRPRCSAGEGKSPPPPPPFRPGWVVRSMAAAARLVSTLSGASRSSGCSERDVPLGEESSRFT